MRRFFFIVSTTKKFEQAVAAVGIKRYRKDLENLRDLINKTDGHLKIKQPTT